MKNLLKQNRNYVGGLVSAKFVLQNKDELNGLEIKSLHEDTKERVEVLKKRTKDITRLQQDILKVEVETQKNFAEFQSYFNNKKPDLTNGDLEKLAAYTVHNISTDKEVAKMYRTEMVARINDFLVEKLENKEISREIAGKLIERCMAALPYRAGSAKNALWDAMNMVQVDRNLGNRIFEEISAKFKNKNKREALAREMEQKGLDNINLNEVFKFDDQTFKIKEIEILTGGAMTKINPQLVNNLKIKNALLFENNGKKQIIAQLENGCEGNFAVIDVEDYAESINVHFAKYGEDKSEHWISGTRAHGRIATVENQQYDELLKNDVNSQLLMANFQKSNIEGLFMGLEKLPAEDREKALGDFFAVLGRNNPEHATKTFQQFVEYMRKDVSKLEDKILKTFDNKIESASDSNEKSLWEAMKEGFLLRQKKIAPEKAWDSLHDIYDKLNNVNVDSLPPELKSLAQEQTLGIKMSTSHLLAMDMLATAKRTLQSTFDEQEDFEDFMKASTAEKKAMLTNEGFWHNSDAQEEVYFSSMQVLEALEYMLTYNYPTDIRNGKKISNPIDFYLKELKTKKGVITQPAGAPKPTVSFVAFDDEMRMFEEYQNGSEKMGDNSIWNLYAGDKSAFNLLNTAQEVFGAKNLMGAKENLGSVEVLRLRKIKNAIANKHYDEARALCIEVLASKLDKPTPKEFSDKLSELTKERRKKIVAQVKLSLKAKNITSLKDLPAGTVDKDGKPYSSFLKFIYDQVDNLLEEQATIQLLSEKSAKISLNDSKLNNFEKKV
jgi:hypothetical protein